MEVEELLSAQTEALRRLMPPIDSFGIGGSHGRGVSDPSSDIDFFLVFPRTEFWASVADFPSLIGHPLRVLSEGAGRFMSDHGYRYAYLLEGGHKVEYHLNAPETMTRLPLSARIRVVADRSGYLTSYLAEAAAEHDRDVRLHVATGVHDCLVDIHDLRKHAARADLLPMIWRLNTLRRPVLALDQMRRTGDAYAPSSAASRLEERSTPEHVLAVGETVPTLDRAEIGAAYERLRAIMLEAWNHFAHLGTPTIDQLELERMLSEAILRSLRADRATGR